MPNSAPRQHASQGEARADRAAAVQIDPAFAVGDFSNLAVQAIVLADELRDEGIGRLFVQHVRGGKLLNECGRQEGDSSSHIIQRGGHDFP